MQGDGVSETIKNRQAHPWGFDSPLCNFKGDYMCDVHLVYNGIKFDEAVKFINNGKKVRRKSWPKERYLFQESIVGEQHSFLDEEGRVNMGVKEIKFFCLEIGPSNYHIWHPTQSDLVIADWEVVDE